MENRDSGKKCEIIINGQMFLMDANAALYVMSALLAAKPVQGRRDLANGKIIYVEHVCDTDALSVSVKNIPANVRIFMRPEDASELEARVKEEMRKGAK